MGKWVGGLGWLLAIIGGVTLLAIALGLIITALLPDVEQGDVKGECDTDEEVSGAQADACILTVLGVTLFVIAIGVTMGEE